MCYLIAKRADKCGCYAIKTKHGKHLADFSHKLSNRVSKKGIQIVTISHPDAYGEKKFEEKIAEMI